VEFFRFAPSGVEVGLAWFGRLEHVSEASGVVRGKGLRLLANYTAPVVVYSNDCCRQVDFSL
jgi:hypothetical protein